MYVKLRNVIYHHLHYFHRVTYPKSSVVVNYYRTSNINKENGLTIGSLLQRNIFNSGSDHEMAEIMIKGKHSSGFFGTQSISYKI